MHFGDFQNEIYFAGLGGARPALPKTPQAWRTPRSRR